MYEKTFPSKRFAITAAFLKEVLPSGSTVLDLGVENPFSEIMKKEGYQVTNTSGEDLDLNTDAVQNTNADAVTAFEIFEHLLAPLNVLKDIKTDKLVASIPLKLWFAPAYRSKTDKWDRHYHEFEDWQFDWLLEKSGWEIKRRKQFTHPVKKLGFRPLLRLFTPRYYLIYAERK
ncbi:MAG: methyltransferase [Leeuwenhoekiella sp.]|uniref:methyltransferase n=1 Tax=unclassified Leeuwenhoekiella TaxID=2615029 RepID=UPI000C3AE2B8|nr:MULTISPECIES: methyltransferase [unclassified Leeuwenhoekiella]MAS21265.1 methyltransferase [Leeuwenhoekiella sp.]MAW93905.1 methyltransferase [Leeuwenhoekiella sp.]MBA81681.1 methyltransferase [Leeuwenhoekiella sp.]